MGLFDIVKDKAAELFSGASEKVSELTGAELPGADTADATTDTATDTAAEAVDNLTGDVTGDVTEVVDNVTDPHRGE